MAVVGIWARRINCFARLAPLATRRSHACLRVFKKKKIHLPLQSRTAQLEKNQRAACLQVNAEKQRFEATFENSHFINKSLVFLFEYANELRRHKEKASLFVCLFFSNFCLWENTSPSVTSVSPPPRFFSRLFILIYLRRFGSSLVNHFRFMTVYSLLSCKSLFCFLYRFNGTSNRLRSVKVSKAKGAKFEKNDFHFF